jgi:[citrate (pro-3S)-lyase] ligase
MARRLPEAGIACHIVPRLEKEDVPVSASVVRQAIHDGDLESIRDLVPESTYRYFVSDEAAPVIAAIQALDDVRHY